MPTQATFDEESGINCYIGVPGKELPLWAGVGGLVYAEGGGQPGPSPMGRLGQVWGSWHQQRVGECARLPEDPD